jgi:putative NADPH-quinone reductase
MNESTILLIDGHPHATSLGKALADEYASGAIAAGARVERLDLRELEFDLVLRGGYAREQQLEPDLLRARSMIERASHVAWQFPLWWAAPPALVKGFVDRLFLPGWAFEYQQRNALPKRLLAGRSARLTVTMDSPWWWYALAYKRSIHGAFANATLSFVGFSPVKIRTIHGVRAMSERDRRALLASMREDGAKDGRALGAGRSNAALAAKSA